MDVNATNKSEEFQMQGVPASPGYAVGTARLYLKKEFDIQSSTIQKHDVLDHINEFKKARRQTEEELEMIRQESEDAQSSEIIAAQVEMVNDPELAHHVEHLIKDKLYAVDFAIQKAFETYIHLMKNAGNSHARERSVDVTDTRNRLLQIVKQHTDTDTSEVEEGCIIVADSLSPREVIRLMKFDIAGIIMDCGGATSHAAIIARSLGIPTIVGAKQAMETIADDDELAMDGTNGRFVIHPSDATIDRFENQIKDAREKEQKLYEVIGKEAVTDDDHPFILRANIEFAEELERVQKVKADGIGLLRSESIYLEKERFENVQQQQEFYSTILENTGDAPVVIRLFDAGGDKIFEDKQKELNPFLGWRGIRMLLDTRDLLRDQLRAILKTAGRYPGRVRILVPMVTLVEEIIELKAEITNIQKDLSGEGAPIDEQPALGMMVEVPAVAVQINAFMDVVDFVSIGTNDLTQYVLAVDRGNELIANMYDQQHPAVWQLIRQVAEAANERNKDVAVCGELASDPTAAACLLGMGIDDLSMSPARLPGVKKMLTDRKFSAMEKLAEQVTSCSSPEEVHELFENWSNKE